MSENDPATKKDLKSLKEGVIVLKQDVTVLKEDVFVLKQDVVILKQEVVTAVRKDLTGVGKRLDFRIDKLDESLQTSVVALMNYIEKEGAKTRQHFDAVVENIRQELAEADKDHFSLQDDRLCAHDKRIARLESVTGIV